MFPYVENHNFYVEHWAHSVLWRKMKDLGAVLQGAGFIVDVNDVFMFKRAELGEVLWDLYSAWAVGAPARGPGHWPTEIERRRGIHQALKRLVGPAGAGHPARGRHRAVHGHALGHHLGLGVGLAQRR